MRADAGKTAPRRLAKPCPRKRSYFRAACLRRMARGLPPTTSMQFPRGEFAVPELMIQPLTRQSSKMNAALEFMDLDRAFEKV